MWSCSASAVASPEATTSESSGSRATVQLTGRESASAVTWVQSMTRSVVGSPLAMPWAKTVEVDKAGNFYQGAAR